MLLGTYAHAEELSMRDFSCGEVTNIPSFRVDPKCSPYMRNVFIDNGQIEGINGYQTIGSTNTLTKITGMFPFVRENGVTTFLVTDSSVTLETADFRTWVTVSSGTNTGTLLTWMQVRNKMWGFNGLDSVMTWDGTNKVKLDGTGTTPNVPKFRYGAYWQDRVWGFNDSVSAGNLDFSSVVTTDAVIINPDDSRAWPVTNQLKIGQGDGEVGTALWVERGQLRCGKERSKHTIYGTSVTNYFARKDVTNSAGVISNDSIVQMDDALYYLANDGIYKDENRISDLIDNSIDAVNKGTQKIITNIWDTQPDFSKGLFFGSTATPDGFLEPNTTTYGYGIPSQMSPPQNDFGTYWSADGILGQPDNGFSLTPGTSFYGPFNYQFGSSKLNANGKYFVGRMTLNYSDNGTCVKFASVTITNGFNGQMQKSTVTDFSGNTIQVIFQNQDPVFDGFDVLASSVQVKIEGCGFDSPAPLTNNNSGGIQFSFKNATTVQYLSEISTLATVTAWGNFDSVNNTNGGNISYFYRTSTSVVTMKNMKWNTINPGVIIGTPTTNNFIQWATTITAISTSPVNTSNIDNVTISHIEGVGALTRAFGVQWKSRYWLATSTDSGNILSLIYVKSKISNDNPNAFMPIEGINIRSFMTNNNILYGGSSSSGSVYRLDYGTNFDGVAIQFNYDFPDNILGNNYMSKDLMAYYLDAEKDSGLSYNVGTSIDGGAFTTKTVSFDGSGRKLYILKGIQAPAKSVRNRIYHSQLDKIFKIYDFTLAYKPTQILEPK